MDTPQLRPCNLTRCWAAHENMSRTPGGKHIGPFAVFNETIRDGIEELALPREAFEQGVDSINNVACGPGFCPRLQAALDLLRTTGYFEAFNGREQD